MNHVDYPHEPGSLYDCPECEDNCFCDGTDACVYCQSFIFPELAVKDCD